MKKFILSYFIFLILSIPCFARDFIVEFVEENYKETQIPTSDQPLIYHSIQVNSSIGPKLLILTGDDYHYRKWLRQYIAQNKEFIAKVPDENKDVFISSKAYEIDINSVHPFSGEKWGKQDIKDKGADLIEGQNHILILDANTTRANLIQGIVNNMANYKARISKNGVQALSSLKKHPEKFKMIITNHTIPGMRSDEFVEQVLKIDHKIPVIVETGYNNKKKEEEFTSKFSKFSSVHVKPVVLKDLQNTIHTLI